MRVVYIDSLFLLNFLMDYLLLLCSARIAGEVLHRLRLALGAAVGALYACALVFPLWAFLSHPLCKISAAAAILLCAFGGSVHLLRLTLIFLAVSAAFGGGILALELLGGGYSAEGGLLSPAPDLRLILLSAALCYGVLSLVFRRSAKHTRASGEVRPAILTLEGRKVMLTALVDTGNTLTDPATNRTVMVAEGDKLSRLFPPGEAPEMAELRDPVAALEHLSSSSIRRRLRLLPYQAVGVECGLLLAVQLDQARVGETEYGKLLVALSPNRLSDGGGYCALVGA